MRLTTSSIGTEAAERAKTSCQHLSDAAWKTGWLLHWARQNISHIRTWVTALLFMINSRKPKDPIIVNSGLSGNGEIFEARRDVQHVENKSYSWNHTISSIHIIISSSARFAPSLQPPHRFPWSAPWQDSAEKWTPLEIVEMHPQSFLHHRWVIFTTQFQLLRFSAYELWSRALLSS